MAEPPQNIRCEVAKVLLTAAAIAVVAGVRYAYEEWAEPERSVGNIVSEAFGFYLLFRALLALLTSGAGEVGKSPISLFTRRVPKSTN